jgi:hypothetical protein
MVVKATGDKPPVTPSNPQVTSFPYHRLDLEPSRGADLCRYLSRIAYTGKYYTWADPVFLKRGSKLFFVGSISIRFTISVVSTIKAKSLYRIHFRISIGIPCITFYDQISILRLVSSSADLVTFLVGICL